MVKQTHRYYVPRKENTKAYSYILQNEYESYKWAHVKIDLVNNEFKTENVKIEETFRTEQDMDRKEDVQKTIKRVSFTRQDNQVKQDNNEDI